MSRQQNTASLWNYMQALSTLRKLHKGRIPKKISTVLVNMVLSPLTPLPQKGLVNRIIVKLGKVFYPPTSCQDREK